MQRNCYSMFKDVFPELVGNIQLGDTLLFDLGSRTLIPVRNMSERLPDFGPALTHTGERFIRYIGVLETEE